MAARLTFAIRDDRKSTAAARSTFALMDARTRRKGRAMDGRLLLFASQPTVKLSPQPHSPVALGLWNTKLAFSP